MNCEQLADEYRYVPQCWFSASDSWSYHQSMCRRAATLCI